MNGQIALYRECCFPNCKKVTFLGFWGVDRPPPDPPLVNSARSKLCRNSQVAQEKQRDNNQYF